MSEVFVYVLVALPYLISAGLIIYGVIYWYRGKDK